MAKKKSFIQIPNKKSKELLEHFKKGGREGAKKDFIELLKRAAQPLKK